MTKYLIQGGLRKVVPEYDIISTFVKDRWRDRSVLEVLSTELKNRDEAYYHSQILAEKIKVRRGKNRKGANLVTYSGVSLLEPVFLLQNSDILERTIHRHEPPVHVGYNADGRIDIIHEDDEICVINKPSGIPCHPTANYYHNTITEILRAQSNGQMLYLCHRLDKLTSGILIMAKSSEAAAKVTKMIKERSVQKEYLARVRGNFPNTSTNSHDNIQEGGDIVVDLPTYVLRTNRSFENCMDEFKPAKTIFRRLSYRSDDDTSMVFCKPLTGRTHQIRLHLQMLGYPIVNDPVYGDRERKCDNLYKWKTLLEKGKENGHPLIDSSLIDAARLEYESIRGRKDVKRELLMNNEVCQECEGNLFYDPDPNELVLWLHALRYYATDESWRFETETPKWAKD
ncbi:pseudouridine synthase [Nadsonia fulvescens var. elongata DSM 6958]|uniref:Pseudouridine synthase n=1 Tax=Nadsonia fulvescens var. elongata DSM 6958 TaxID=857566 RepID=A0A1E3PLI1_9ASCO|nr:pseudouridine synthase [Nadsonia fulvescens var. elongata DSM 6958]